MEFCKFDQKAVFGISGPTFLDILGNPSSLFKIVFYILEH